MNRVMVKIHGSEYPMVGDKPEELMIKVASFVDKEMTKVTESNPRLSLSVSAILTALNITDLLFECSEANDQLTKENEALKNNTVTPDEELKLQLEELEKSLKMKEKELSDSKAKINELTQIIDKQKNEIFGLSDTAEKSQEEVDKHKLEVEELLSKIEEANERASIAESLSSEFQNKAYDLQLKYTELKNKVDNLKE